LRFRHQESFLRPVHLNGIRKRFDAQDECGDGAIRAQPFVRVPGKPQRFRIASAWPITDPARF
jgi:hypothetical protein